MWSWCLHRPIVYGFGLEGIDGMVVAGGARKGGGGTFLRLRALLGLLLGGLFGGLL